ncbi:MULTISPECIES: ferredoxin--NADP reductase domain-containing protein [Catenuloplanes]|uniref:Ferredoxin--NADP+ reductase n=1 Tax=Catenuloplanes niger TaxID=587534 RepID=A0AAE4D085_9ACTN|nr:pyridine nucleotide-disulfide oxidoreductase [Catenuloplanes niger]MDR7327674.1 ferredoxin--NADP+ reductase [Catenuloplanes niger]
MDSLHDMLDGSDVRLFCDVEIGGDLTVDELRGHYDAVIVATGALRDVPFDLPGIGLPGSFGAADFVAWYDSHPDAAPTWPLEAASVAVIGAGNVALDVTRMLIRHARTLADTDIAPNVMAALATNPISDIHLYARRGPADTRFSPTELRELGQQTDVDVIVDPADLVTDRHVERMTRQFAPTRQVVETLRHWSRIPPADRTASRRVHLHFHRIPSAVLGTTRVEGLRTERAVPDGYGHVTGSGEYRDQPVRAVYRAVGYAATPLDGVPFDPATHTVPHRAGAVLDDHGRVIPGLYVTGWIKRGCVGLIGSTRSDARQTVETLLGARHHGQDRDGADHLLRQRGLTPIDWNGWLRIDAAERALGAARHRHRTKIANRAELVRHAHTPASPTTTPARP